MVYIGMKTKIQIMIKGAFVSIVTVFFLLVVPSIAKEKIDDSLEANTKAVFMYNFSKYTQWPKGDTSKYFNIVVLGKTDVLIPLENIAEKRQVNKKKIKITQYKFLPENLNCNILFISSSQTKNLSLILEKVKGKSILTIGDTEGFAKRGVVLNFIIDNGNVKFEINSDVLDHTDLKMSSQLLKLSNFIKEK